MCMTPKTRKFYERMTWKEGWTRLSTGGKAEIIAYISLLTYLTAIFTGHASGYKEPTSYNFQARTAEEKTLHLRTLHQALIQRNYSYDDAKNIANEAIRINRAEKLGRKQ